MTRVGETGSGKTIRQSSETVKEPSRSACVGGIRDVSWAVLSGGLRSLVEKTSM